MIKFLMVFTFLIFSVSITAQNKKKPVEELINKAEPAWPNVLEWIGKAKNSVEILPCDSVKAKDALYKTQVTTRSPMGAIVYATGGILIDSGWIRILGSGNTKLNRTLPDWNKGKSFKEFGEAPSFYLIADDAVGGFFAINGGGFGKETAGKVYYLSPGSLIWENLDITYTNFLLFCFNGKLSTFYKNVRWNTWNEDIKKLDGNSVFSFFPFLWSKEGKDVNKNSKTIIPIEEHYLFTTNSRKKLGL
jgi:hypothetical protein